jgi:hypothetical protein
MPVCTALGWKSSSRVASTFGAESLSSDPQPVSAAIATSSSAARRVT